MARSDQVKRLLESHERGDDAEFRRVAQEVVAEERRKRHDSLADELERVLSRREARRPLNVSSLQPLPKTREDAPLLRLVEGRAPFTDLVLRKETSAALLEVVEECQRRAVLSAHSLRPRQHLLFIGPPGCGKSLSADAIATALGLPIAKVQLASVVSSFLGETAKHLQQILTYCEHGAWVLLFDEIDMLAAKRGDQSDHGELRRVVTTFLQLLDDFAGDALVIATSNHPQLLDEAVWRRFDDVIVFDLPTQADIGKLLRLKLRGIQTRFSHPEAARKLKGCSHAEVEMVCLDAARRVVLSGRDVVVARDISAAIDRMRQRRQAVGRFAS